MCSNSRGSAVSVGILLMTLSSRLLKLPACALNGLPLVTAWRLGRCRSPVLVDTGLSEADRSLPGAKFEREGCRTVWLRLRAISLAHPRVCSGESVGRLAMGIGMAWLTNDGGIRIRVGVDIACGEVDEAVDRWLLGIVRVSCPGIAPASAIDAVIDLCGFVGTWVFESF